MYGVEYKQHRKSGHLGEKCSKDSSIVILHSSLICVMSLSTRFMSLLICVMSLVTCHMSCLKSLYIVSLAAS